MLVVGTAELYFCLSIARNFLVFNSYDSTKDKRTLLSLSLSSALRRLLLVRLVTVLVHFDSMEVAAATTMV